MAQINFSSGEIKKERLAVSGKISLIISLTVILIVIATYLVLAILNKSEIAKKEKLENLYSETKFGFENNPQYVEMVNFQNKLKILSQIAGDHFYWNNFLSEISQYILPEVYLKEISAGSGKVSMKGLATNFEAITKQLQLLQSYSGVESVELIRAAENTGQTEGGITFEIDVIPAKSTLVNKNENKI